MHISELNSILPESVPHPGLCHCALESYVSLQSIYDDIYSFDPNYVKGAQFRELSKMLRQICQVFNSPHFFHELLKIIRHANQEISQLMPLQVANANPLKPIIHEVPPNGHRYRDCENRAHIAYFQDENVWKRVFALIPETFLRAQQAGLGYLEIKTVISPRRTNRTNEVWVRDGNKVGFSVVFVSNGRLKVIPILSAFPASWSFHVPGNSVAQFYDRVLFENTRLHEEENFNLHDHIDALEQEIFQDARRRAAQLGLVTARDLLATPNYHSMLKASHFLMAFAAYVGFSPDALLQLRNELPLYDLAECLQNLEHAPLAEFPKLTIVDENAEKRIMDLIHKQLANDDRKFELEAYSHQIDILIETMEMEHTMCGFSEKSDTNSDRRLFLLSIIHRSCIFLLL